VSAMVFVPDERRMLATLGPACGQQYAEFTISAPVDSVTQ
jgi:hypothetical protein